MHRMLRRYVGLFGTLVALAGGAVAAATPATAQSLPQIVSPEVIHTGAAPTGYEVTSGITTLGLRLGGGLQDQNWIPGVYTYEQNLTAAGIPYTVDPMDGGHEWYTWRQMLYDFVRTVAFRRTTTSVTLQGPLAQAQVTSDTTEPRHPHGHRPVLRRWQPGRPTGAARPRRRAHRAAAGGPHMVSAAYSGDDLYNSSTSATVSVG